jgi:hypothetical protein
LIPAGTAVDGRRARIPHYALARFTPPDVVQPFLTKGCLERALEDCCPPFPGYHL